MVELVTARGVPNEAAKKAREYLRRRNIVAVVTKDGITTIEVIVPHTMTADETMSKLHAGLGYDPANPSWEYKHTEFMQKTLRH